MASGLKRQQAPVIVAGDKLKKGEVIYITYSLIANQKGQPLIQRWLGIRFINGQFNYTNYRSHCSGMIQKRTFRTPYLQYCIIFIAIFFNKLMFFSILCLLLCFHISA